MDGAEDELVARLLLSEPRAWESLLEQYGPLIASACRRALARGPRPVDPSSVADASADVVRALLEADLRLLRKYRPGSSLAAYLRVIARSVAFKSFRHPPPGTGWLEAGSEEDPVALAAQASERTELLKTALADLPARDAEALRLFHLDGMSYAEISLCTGLPAGQVGVLLKRARERLRAKLGPDFQDRV